MNDLGFDIIMGGNDYEFIGKTNVDNKKKKKKKKPYYFHKKIKRLYEKLANVIIVTIKQKY